LYVVDIYNFTVRKITPGGIVSIIAGTGKKGYLDGKAEEAMFSTCYGIAVGFNGDIYISDTGNQVIRKLSNGVVSTLAGKPEVDGIKDGRGEEALFNYPRGICIDSDGSILVADAPNARIRRVELNGFVSTFVGNERGKKDGNLNEAQFKYPTAICRNGNDIYVCDNDANCVKKITNGKVNSLKGIDGPTDLTFLSECLYTISSGQHKIFVGEDFKHFAGSGEKGHKDGDLLDATFFFLNGVVASNGNLFMCDDGNQCIRKLQVFEEWTISSHLFYIKPFQDAVKTLMLMKNKRNNVWNSVPKDILFVIFNYLNKNFWD
jgi:hypothetical protein